MKKFCSSLLLLLFQLMIGGTTTLFSQTLSPFLINSTGNYSTAGFGSISSSVGEAVITTATSGTLTLTQGFQQPSVLGCPTAFSGFNVTPVSTICAGTNVTITPIVTGGSLPYTYSWSSGESTSSISVAPTLTTAYTLTLVGCGMMSTQSITVNPLPSVLINGSSNFSSTICTGSTTLIATPAAMSSYSWAPATGLSNPNISNPVASPTITTVYTVTVTSPNSCSASSSATVHVTPPAPVASAGTDQTICGGTIATLNANTASPGTGTWTLIGGPGSANFADVNLPASTVTVTASGTYAFKWNIANPPCASTSATVTVNFSAIPTVTINSQSPYLTTICQGNTITLSATLGHSNYIWSPSAGLNNASLSNPMASPTISTEYTVTVTNVNGCIAMATASITVSPAIGANTSITSVTCVGSCDGSATANPTGGISPYSFSWSSGGGTASTASNLCMGMYTVTITDLIGCMGVATASVTAPAPLTTTISVNQPNCGCNGVAYANTSGGNAPYTYAWSPSGQTTQITSGLCISQTVTITDNKGCNISTTASLSPSPGVIVTGVSPATICAGSSTTIGVTSPGGPHNYAWSPGGGTADIITVSPATSTTFVVIVSNPVSGCKDTGYVPVTVNALPAVNITGGGTSLCAGGSATLSASGGNSYSWSSGQNVSTIVVSPTAQQGYTVTVTNSSGCSDTASTTINITPSPVAAIATGPSTSICSGTSVTLTANGGATYLWLHNSLAVTSITETPGVNTTYTLVAYNGTCSDTATQLITVSSMSTSINGNATLCVGNSSVLSAVPTGIAPFTYAWIPAAITPSVTAGPYTIPGQYNFSVTITDGIGCTASAAQSVTVTAAPAPFITASSQTLCVAQTATLSASGGSNYVWSNGGTTSTINVTSLVSGNITYSVSASNGNCFADTFIVISFLPLPSITAAISDPVICPGDSVILTAGGGVGYSWLSIGIGNPITVFPTASATYTVIGLGVNGCYNIANTIVTLSDITADAGADQTICPGFTAALNVTVSGSAGTLNYQWYPAVYLNDSTVQNPSATPDSTTIFMVEVSNQDGCHDKDTITVHIVYSAGCVIHIYNGITPNGDGNNDVWWIDGIAYFPDNNVSIFNRWGTEVWSASGYNNKSVVWTGLDKSGNALPNGTYYYVVRIKLDSGSSLDFSKWVELTK